MSTEKISVSEYVMACAAYLFDDPIDLPAWVVSVEESTAPIDLAAVVEFQDAAAEQSDHARRVVALRDGGVAAQCLAADDAARARYLYALTMGRVG